MNQLPEFHGISLNNQLAPFSLINLDFSLLQTTHFDKSIYFSLFVFATPGFLLSVFFLHLKQ